MNTEEMLTQILDGQKAINNRLDTMQEGQQAINSRLDTMQEGQQSINNRLDTMQLEIDKRFDAVQEDIAEIKEEAMITRTATNAIGENFDELIKILNETKTIVFKRLNKQPCKCQ